MNVDIGIQVTCPAHEKEFFTLLHLNEPAVAAQLLESVMGDIMARSHTKEEFVQLLVAESDDKTLCCMVSQDVRDRIVADTPQSTGDPEEDEHVAMELTSLRKEPPRGSEG